MSLLVISAEQVQQLLPMAACIEAVEAAMIATSSGTIDIPPRRFDPLIDNSGFLGLMPGSSVDLASYGAKVISIQPANSGRGLPVIQGFVALFDHDSGAPLAIVEGASLTGIRTAAASGLATRVLSREDARSCGIFGTGVQAVTHIDAMLAVREVEVFYVWGRDAAKTRYFAEQQSARTGVAVIAVEEPARAAACDLVCTLTASPTPVLKGDWVRPGAHVNLVGSHSLDTREADTELISKGALYVDLMASCRNEGGNFMIPVREGAIEETAILGEIGQVLLGEVPGRERRDQITVYNSLGITAQDLFSARQVYERALVEGVGTRAEL